MPILNSANIYNEYDNQAIIQGENDNNTKVEGKNYYIKYSGDLNHIIAKITSNTNDEYILNINGWIKHKDDNTLSRVDLSFVISDTIEKNGIYTGNQFINTIIENKIVSISLNQASWYGLHIITRPLLNNDEDVSINFDKTDINKYYLTIL